MHEFKPGDPVYILSGRGDRAEKVHGTVTECWSRYVSIQFPGLRDAWPFRASSVYHAEQEINTTEVSGHVLC